MTNEQDYAAFYRKRQLVGMLYALKAIKKGNFKLSSGNESDCYVDSRIAALDPETLSMVAPQISDIITKYTFDSIGCMEGPGSVAMLGALLVAYGAKRTNKPITGFVVRKQAKTHGMGKMLEGVCGQMPILIDDVATSGKSIIHAVNNMPYKPIAAIVLLDRGEGAHDALAKLDIPLCSVLTMADLIL